MWANLKKEEGDGGATRNGMKHSEETKQIFSIKKMGHNNPMKRPELRERMREIAKKRKQNEESNKKRSISLKGKKRPNEIIEKIREGLLGKKLSKEHIESLKGKRKP